MMDRKILLLLAADSLHAWLWNRGTLSAAQNFAGDKEGFEQLSAFLKINRDPAYLLTDLSEEDYRLETLPHLSGSDRRSLIRRKLGQLYRNTPFRQAMLQQRRNDGQRDDNVLFSALTNPSPILVWLDVLLARRTAIAGIYSIPTISAPLVADIPSRHLLLVSREIPGGLRQTYFNDNFLRFSRLSTIHPNSSFGEIFTEEVEHTRQYLKNLNLLPADQDLDVRVICHENDQRELEARFPGKENVRYSCISLQELGKRIKSSPDFANSDTTPLFLHLLATRRYRSHYASSAHTHYFRLARIRRSLNILSAILATISLPWSVANVTEGNNLNADRASDITAKNLLTQRTAQLARQSPASPASISDMKSAVVLARKLAGDAPDPHSMLDELSSILSDFPDLRIEKLEWQSAMASAEKLAVHSANQYIMLTGELEQPGPDAQEATGYVDRFRLALNAQGHDATLVSLAPGTGFGGGSDKPLNTRFILKIDWRSTP